MRGSIRRTGKQSWAIIVDAGRDANGKRKQRWHTVRGTRKEAERERVRLLGSIDSGSYIEPTKTTLGTFLESWLRDYAKDHVAAKTRERYEEIIEKGIAPAIGHIRLSKLQPADIQRYYAEALATGRKDGKGGLSSTTVLQHHRVLRAALQRAVRWDLLVRNPADVVDAPRKSQREARALDVDETVQLLEAAKNSRLYVPILVAVTTGVRRGELLGLRWTDIDFEGSLLKVRQSLEQTRAGITMKAPKTPKSRRDVALPTIAVEVLWVHRVEQSKRRLMMGPAYHDNGLVFAAPDGSPWVPLNFTGAFIALTRRPGVPKINFHGLRHSAATLLLKEDVNPKIVSDRLGHSTIGTTLDCYSHVLPGMQAEAAKKIDAAIRGAIDKAKTA